jgi:hypothetical protein
VVSREAVGIVKVLFITLGSIVGAFIGVYLLSGLIYSIVFIVQHPDGIPDASATSSSASTPSSSASTASDGGGEQRTIAGPFTPGCYQDVNAWYDYLNEKKAGLDASVSDDAMGYRLSEGDTVTVLENDDIDDHPGLQMVTGDLVRVRLNDGPDAGHTCWVLDKLDLSMPNNGNPFK